MYNHNTRKHRIVKNKESIQLPKRKYTKRRNRLHTRSSKKHQLNTQKRRTSQKRETNTLPKQYGRSQCQRNNRNK